jgi:hypothetical protein
VGSTRPLPAPAPLPAPRTPPSPPVLRPSNPALPVAAPSGVSPVAALVSRRRRSRWRLVLASAALLAIAVIAGQIVGSEKVIQSIRQTIASWR